MGRRVKPSPPGLVLADKPAGLGSAALVARLRRELENARVGHAGTLDRFATGLMILLVGQGTALADVLLHQDKTYEATFGFGRATDTHDPSGETIGAERSMADARLFIEENRERIVAALQEIQSRPEQTPPAYSALKREGRRFSDLARSGAAIMPAARPVRIYEIDELAWDPDHARFAARLDVSSGTYIRSIARDLGELLEFPVHLAGLRRLRIGRLRLEDPAIWAPGEEDPADAANPARAVSRPRVLELWQALPGWRREAVSGEDLANIRNGRRIRIKWQPEPGEDFFLVGPGDCLVAWGRGEAGGGYVYRRVFSENLGSR